MKKIDRTAILKIVILVAFFCTMPDSLLTPAMNDIATSFPDVSSTLFNLFLTGPMFTGVVGTLLCGSLARIFSKKALLVFGYIVFSITASGGALVDNMAYMVVMRLLSGFAYGIVATVLMGLIAELFTKESERSFMMGANSSVTAAFGVILSLIGGYLADHNWHYVFYAYLFGVPILILILIFIPKTPPEGKRAGDEQSGERDKLPVKTLGPIALAIFLYGTLIFIPIYYLSFYLAEANLGDASVAGIIASVGTAGGFVSGLLFTFLYMRLRRATSAICFLLSALSFIIMAFSSNIWLIVVMIFVGNFATIQLTSYYYMYASMIMPPGVMTLSIAILTAAMSIGGFFSSFIFDTYQRIFRLETVASTYLYIGIYLAIAAVVSAILAIRSRNAVSEETQV
jgi:MFS family permease